MSMINWNEYRQQVSAGIAEMAKSSPDIVRGYRTIANARAREGALDAKTRELVALAVAVTVRASPFMSIWRRRTARPKRRSPTRSASR